MENQSTHSNEPPNSPILYMDKVLPPLVLHEDEPALEGGVKNGIPEEGNACWKYFRPIRVLAAVIVPYGGLLSSSFNMASATLGAGIISLPSGFNLSGIAMAILYLVVITIATVFSMTLIAHVILRTGLTNFSMAARKLMGRGADYFLAALIIILCFGGSVAYIIAASTLLDPVLKASDVPYLKTDSANKLFTSLVWLVLMLPLVVMKRINSLRYFSSLGVIFIVYFVFCMIYHSVTNGMENPEIKDQLIVFRTGNAALEGLGSFLFAFMCQLNAFEIFLEQKHKTVFHFTLYATLSMTGCAILYFCAGFFGYLDFGSQVVDSVLVLYNPVHEPYIAVGYVGIIFKICVAFALHMIPMRDAIYHCLKWEAMTIPYWKHALVMAFPTTIALIFGLYVPTLNTVLGLLGSFCGAIIGFIFPALMFMYCGDFTLHKVGWKLYLGTYLLLMGGVVAMVFGTSVTIYSTVLSKFSS